MTILDDILAACEKAKLAAVILIGLFSHARKERENFWGVLIFSALLFIPFLRVWGVL